MGSVLSCVAPAVGRLTFANCPPLGCSHFHTFGSTYSLALSVIAVPSLAQPAGELGTGAGLGFSAAAARLGAFSALGLSAFAGLSGAFAFSDLGAASFCSSPERGI